MHGNIMPQRNRLPRPREILRHRAHGEKAMTQKTIDLIDRLLLRAARQAGDIGGPFSQDAAEIRSAYAEFGEWTKSLDAKEAVR